jgi:hypothetical protein
MFIIYYYLPTTTGRCCSHQQGVTQEYKQLHKTSKRPNVIANILSTPYGHKM